MVKIRTLDFIARKWHEVTTKAGPLYEAGVKVPKKIWEEEAVKAEKRWGDALTEAIRQRRYSGGIARVGQKKWEFGATRKGPRRFEEGVAISEPFYRTGWGPYRDKIEEITLPERFPAGDPRNLERVKAVALPLHALKLELLRRT